MCKKVKDVKQEEMNRLKEKYSYVLNGILEMNLEKISNFVNLVLPVLVLQFLKQENSLRYKCYFECIEVNKSFATKFGYVQHLCLKHTDKLPGGGLFLLQRQEKTLEKIKQLKNQQNFECIHCGKSYKRKKPYERHEQSCAYSELDGSRINVEIISLEDSFSTIVLD